MNYENFWGDFGKAVLYALAMVGAFVLSAYLLAAWGYGTVTIERASATNSSMIYVD